MLDRVVAQNFARHTAVAAADDQHPAGVPVGDDGRMGHHLMIDELIALGRLHDAVQRQEPPELGVLKDLKALMLGLAVIENRIDLQALPVGAVKLFVKPGHDAASTIPSPRRNSFTCTSAALNARRSTSTARRGSASPHMKTSNAP